MTERWPCDILPSQDVAWNIAPRTLAAPSSVSGITQVVASDAGIWKAMFGSVLVNTRDRILTFRGIAARLEGRLGDILVPRCGAWRPDLAADAGDAIFDQVPHSDNAWFDDDTGYVISDRNSMYLATALPARATVANIVIRAGGTITPGQDFSLGERMYRVTAVTYTTPTTATLTFRPPAREAVDEGVTVEFDAPICRMRLASDDAMDLELALHRFGAPTINFLEAL